MPFSFHLFLLFPLFLQCWSDCVINKYPNVLSFDCNDFDVQVLEDRILFIHCRDNLTNFDLHQLPKISLQQLDDLRITNCPKNLPRFYEIFEHFQANNVSSFTFASSHSKNMSLRFEDFEKLEQIQELVLTSNNLKNIESGTFLDLQKLIVLDLTHNRIKLTKDMFFGLNSLENLILSDNFIKFIPPEIFIPLKNLFILEIVQNELTSLKAGTFSNLTSLEFLDLRSNKIRFVAATTFIELKKLKKINLANNQIQTVTLNTFSYNQNLRTVILDDNSQLSLSDFAFSNLKKLMKISLNGCELKKLPENLFHYSHNLEIIVLGHNKLEVIPKGFFKDLNKLKVLKLNNNNLTSVFGIFNGLKNLQHLDLENNRIVALGDGVFRELVSLKSLNMKNNLIRSLKIGVLFNREIYFAHLKLDFSCNNISSDLKLAELKHFSNIFINLNENSISVVNFDDFQLHGQIKIALNKNPIDCTCQNYGLVEFLQKPSKNLTIMGNLKCGTKFNLESIVCSLKEIVKSYHQICLDQWRPFDKTIIINCTHQNLTNYPKINLKEMGFLEYKQIELHLEHNNLGVGPGHYFGYENVTKLFLSNNLIQTIKWLPPKLEVLQLDHNHLTHLDQQLITQLHKPILKNLTLHENFWFCDCTLLSLIKFVQDPEIPINRTLVCSNLNERFININPEKLCSHWYHQRIYLGIMVLSLLLTGTIMVVIYYRWEEKIKVWLYAKNLYRVSEEKMDRHKVYDAFLSYSHKDEDFVVQTLIPVLESAPYFFKLCLHYRNWVPGEFITSQIENSVVESRRTIVILSRNFLDSVWTKLEFRAAYSQAIKEKRTRVIIIIYEDVDLDDLDPDLKFYLKTNTYVKWGDPFFWHKLIYALPHKKITEESSINLLNKI